VGVRFSVPIQTGPGARPASYTMGTGSFPGVKRLRHGVDHPPPSSTMVKERVGLYHYYPSGPSWPVLGWTLHLYCVVIFIFVSILKCYSFSLFFECMCCPVLMFHIQLSYDRYWIFLNIYICVCMLCLLLNNPEIAFYRPLFSEYVVTAYVFSYETFTWWIHPRLSVHTSNNLLLDS